MFGISVQGQSGSLTGDYNKHSPQMEWYAKIARKAMFAPAEGVYPYGLCLVCPLTTPGVGVGIAVDIVCSNNSSSQSFFCLSRISIVEACVF